MIGAFVKAFLQLGDPTIRRIAFIAVGAAIGIFLVLIAAIGWLLGHTELFRLIWLDTVIDILGGVATLVLAWLLFPAVVSACVGFFLDRVADAVERRHYPNLPPVRDAPIGEVIGTTVRFLAVMIALNLLVLIFLLVPPVFPFVFYAVNGYLLGREYFELVALRRLDMAETRVVRTLYRGRLFMTGLIIVFLLTVPILNLIAPIIGTAAMVHLFESWRPWANRQGPRSV